MVFCLLDIRNVLLTGLRGPYLEIRSLIFFVRPELARVVRKSEGFVFLVWYHYLLNKNDFLARPTHCLVRDSNVY